MKLRHSGWVMAIVMAFLTVNSLQALAPTGAFADSGADRGTDRATDHAATTELMEDRLTLGTGIFVPYSGKVTRFEAGNVTFADQLLPIVSAEYRLRTERLRGFALVPQFWITPLSSALKDSAGGARWMSASLLVSQQEKAAEFRAGGGWLLQWITGSGGDSVQQNGSSTTTYALPDRAVIVRMLTLQAGLSYQHEHLRFSADLIGTGLLTSRRSANAVFGVGYAFGSGP